MRACLRRTRTQAEAGCAYFPIPDQGARFLCASPSLPRIPTLPRHPVENSRPDPLQSDLLCAWPAVKTQKSVRARWFIVVRPKQSIYDSPRDVGAYRRMPTISAMRRDAVTLQTSFRSVPAIQHFVNAAFRDDMNGDRDALQADYVPLLPHRPAAPEQPAVVALPIAYPYGKSIYGPPQVTQTALNEAQPGAIGASSRGCCHRNGRESWHGGQRERSSQRCLFRSPLHAFRRGQRASTRVPRRRGIPHCLCGKPSRA